MPDTTSKNDSSSRFAGLIGQEHAARVLEGILAGGAPSHAYLLHGPRGTGKMAAALGFAAALCCPDGGCGDCRDCRKAAAGTHPDIAVIAPVGAFITVDQIRAINRSINLHPGESRARVYIISPAEAFNSESANAFLKTLEEPPPYAYFLLLAANSERVLPTIVSRCQTIRFAPVPAARIEARLQTGAAGVSATMALTFARVSRGDAALALRLTHDTALAGRRERYLELAGGLTRGNPAGGAGGLADALLELVEEAVAGREFSADAPEGFETATRKQLEQDAHRRESAARREELMLALDFLATWFRDLMVMACGAGDAIHNKDFELELEGLSLPSKAPGYAAAAATVEAARAKLGYNIDLELAMQAMFHELQEVL